MVRGLPALGRLCDARSNGELLARLNNDGRWRDARNRWSIVVWRSDVVARENGPLNAVFGSDRLTLVYDYTHVVSRGALAELLLDVYDVKLHGLRVMPPIWWYDLEGWEQLAITRLNRVEFAFFQSPPAVRQADATAQLMVDEGFDPNTQVAGNDPMVLADFCTDELCYAAATHSCPRCLMRLCLACWQRNHEEEQCIVKV